MRRHKNHRVENAILTGIIVFFIVSLTYLLGADINAKVVDEGGNLSRSDADLYFKFLVIVIIISSLFFVATALSALISEIRSIESDGERLKEFVSQCNLRGYTKEEITALLRKYGWIEHEIDKYF